MVECDYTVALQRPDPRFGIPNPTFYKPVVMVNKQIQEAPPDWRLPVCHLPVGVPVVTSTATTMTFTDPVSGNTLVINTENLTLRVTLGGVQSVYNLTED